MKVGIELFPSVTRTRGENLARDLRPMRYVASDIELAPGVQ